MLAEGKVAQVHKESVSVGHQYKKSAFTVH